MRLNPSKKELLESIREATEILSYYPGRDFVRAANKLAQAWTIIRQIDFPDYARKAAEGDTHGKKVAADFWRQAEKIKKTIAKLEAATRSLEKLNSTIDVEAVPEAILLGAIRRLRSGLDGYASMWDEYIDEKGNPLSKKWATEDVARELVTMASELVNKGNRKAGRWEHRWNEVKRILRDYEDEEEITDEIAAEAGERIGKFLLKKVDGIADEYEGGILQDIAESIRDSSDVEDFDYYLGDLYNWADANRVWLGL